MSKNDKVFALSRLQTQCTCMLVILAEYTLVSTTVVLCNLRVQ